MDSYERIGTSNYYYDHKSGMFWDQDGYKWLTRAQYEVNTTNAWKEYNQYNQANIGEGWRDGGKEG